MIDRLTVQQAALRLGIQPDAVRRRIQRGKLNAEKIDGEWIVLLGSVTATEQAPAATVTAPEPAPNNDLVRELRERVTDLQRQNDLLAEQLRHVQADSENKTQILGRQAALLLQAHDDTEPARNSTEQTTEQPRRSFWARLRKR